MPNGNLHKFRGRLHLFRGPEHDCQSNTSIPITMSEMLLRGTLLKNSNYVIGLVVYTGKETRIQKNAARVPLKVGSFDRFLNIQIAILISVQVERHASRKRRKGACRRCCVFSWRLEATVGARIKAKIAINWHLTSTFKETMKMVSFTSPLRSLPSGS